MNILWHSIKYPPKKDGMYYVRSHSSGNGAVLKDSALNYYEIRPYSYTVQGGWNTHIEFDNSVYTKAKMYFPNNAQWAEAELYDEV